MLLVGLVAVVVGLAVVLGALLTRRDTEPGQASAPDERAEPPPRPTDQPEAEELNPSQAFAKALRQIEEGGSFRYSGAAHAAEASVLRPTRVFAQPVAVEGEVDLPHRVHEIASDGSETVFETTVVGPGIWERTNSVAAGPAATPPYRPSGRGAMEMGAGLLPTWLRTATDRAAVDAAEARRVGAESGIRMFRAELQLADVTGPVEIAIGLDADDVLTHVWIAKADAPFFVDWEISGIGDPIEIPPPGDELTDAFVDISHDDLAAAGIDRPVHLTEVPAGWVLAAAWIEPDAPSTGCSTLNLDYQPVDAAANDRRTTGHLDLDVMATSCTPPGEETGDPLAVGSMSGVIYADDGWADGYMADATTRVKFDSSNLPPSDVERLLGSLAPFDPEVQPTEVDLG